MLFRTRFTARLRRPLASRHVLVAFVVAGFVIAGAADAQRRCEQDAAITGRICTVETCLSLQSVVTNLCKNNQLFSCDELELCPSLIEMRQRWFDCAKARDRINGICWRGGNTGHITASAQAWQNVGTCNARIVEKCADTCPFDDIFNMSNSVRSDASVELALFAVFEQLAAGVLLNVLLGSDANSAPNKSESAANDISKFKTKPHEDRRPK